MGSISSSLKFGQVWALLVSSRMWENWRWFLTLSYKHWHFLLAHEGTDFRPPKPPYTCLTALKLLCVWKPKLAHGNRAHGEEQQLRHGRWPASAPATPSPVSITVLGLTTAWLQSRERSQASSTQPSPSWISSSHKLWEILKQWLFKSLSSGVSHIKTTNNL